MSSMLWDSSIADSYRFTRR